VREGHGLDRDEAAAGGQLLHQDRTGEHFLSGWNRLERDVGWIVRGQLLEYNTQDMTG
jgi:hypothetical protein